MRIASRIPLPARLCGYALVVASLIYVNVWYESVLLFLASLVLTGPAILTVAFLEVLHVLRQEDSLRRVAQEVMLILFAVGALAGIGPLARHTAHYVRGNVQREHLAEFEKRLDPQHLIAVHTIHQGGFAGSNHFSLLVFDRSGEIERPPERRTEAWWAAARRADGVFACWRGTGVPIPDKRHFYAVDLPC